jgi:hypothetical protein
MQEIKNKTQLEMSQGEPIAITMSTDHEDMESYIMALAKEYSDPEGPHVKRFNEEMGGNKLFEAFTKVLHALPDTTKDKSKLLKRAYARRYHDLEGDLMKIGLYQDLMEAGLSDLASRVVQGEFDF